jgi:hypothetical protein
VEPVARGAELGSRKVSMAVRDRALVPGWPPRWLALGPVCRQNEGSSGLRASARTLLTCDLRAPHRRLSDRDVTGDSLYVVLLGILQHVSQNFRAGYC